jgi:hypothetical protein
MTIDIFNESLLTFNEARALPVFLVRGRRASLNKMYRLAQIGSKNTNGERVRLETVQTPSGIRTSREAIERFIARLTNPDIDIPTPPPARRKEQIDNAVADLEAQGFEVGATA